LLLESTFALVDSVENDARKKEQQHKVTQLTVGAGEVGHRFPTESRSQHGSQVGHFKCVVSIVLPSEMTGEIHSPS